MCQQRSSIDLWIKKVGRLAIPVDAAAAAGNDLAAGSAQHNISAHNSSITGAKRNCRWAISETVPFVHTCPLLWSQVQLLSSSELSYC
eukprot:6637-Heterococcus_DN1.PRE.2